MNADLILGIVLLAIGVLCCGMFARHILRRRALKKHGVTTTGTVQTVMQVGDHKSSTVEYADHQGEIHMVVFPHIVGRKGDEVTVTYDPNNPARAHTGGYAFVLWLIFGALALVRGSQMLSG